MQFSATGLEPRVRCRWHWSHSASCWGYPFSSWNEASEPSRSSDDRRDGSPVEVVRPRVGPERRDRRVARRHYWLAWAERSGEVDLHEGRDRTTATERGDRPCL